MKNYHYMGIDTGGTFTDFVLLSGEKISIHKVLSTPDDPSRAIMQGIDELGLSEEVLKGRLVIVHGSTVATNAALEKKGVKTVYVANKGLKDVLTLARQNRPQLYNLTPDPIEPPVPEALCLEVDCRLDFEGHEITALKDKDVEQLVADIKALNPESVAINLLFSFLDDRHEKRIEAELADLFFVSRSSFVLPEYKEYERGIATWLNAWLGPKVDHYLGQLVSELHGCSVSMMQSSGGTVDVAQAAKRTVNLLLSGPAGGLAATQFIGRMIGESRFITFDMGGTSTDVALIDGGIRLTNEGRIGLWPVAVPMVDMHTIGAGGGSLGWIDGGGMLQVGPESAGAAPGPACYGQGGIRPTVTDANLLLGKLRPEAFLGGSMSLDVRAAEKAITPLADEMNLTHQEAALGIISVANEHMNRALRAISIQRGYDPTQFRLCCFGGAGGLHVCALADAMSMKKAIVPVHGGVLSAFGMLVAPHERQLSHTNIQRLSDVDEDSLLSAFEGMAQKGRAELEQENVDPAEIVVKYSVDLRYLGQSFTLNLDWCSPLLLIEQFHDQHCARYGHRMDRQVEMVNLRVSVTSPGQRLSMRPPASGSGEPFDAVAIAGYEYPVPVYQRGALRVDQVLVGPLLITEKVSTTMVEKGWHVVCDSFGNLLLDRVEC
mgnify:CR=1 FL=1